MNFIMERDSKPIMKKAYLTITEKKSKEIGNI